MTARDLDIGFELLNFCKLQRTHRTGGSHQARTGSLDLDLFGRIGHAHRHIAGAASPRAGIGPAAS